MLLRNRLVLASFIALVVASVGGYVSAGYKCCDVVPNAEECSGCRDTPEGHVNLGGGSAVSRCETTTNASHCTMTEVPCTLVDDANTYNETCTKVTGTLTLEVMGPECNVGSIPCGGA